MGNLIVRHDAGARVATGATAVTGMPPPAVLRFTTRNLPRDARFDAWRGLFTAPILERPRGSDAGGFGGELRRVVMADGISYSNLRADSHLCRFGERDSDLILFGVIRNGCVEVRHGRDDRLVLRPESGVVLYDCGRPMATQSPCSELTYLTLPRSLVAHAIGGDPVARGAAARLLRPNALTVDLGACLLGLERDRAFEVDSVARAVDVAKAVALVALAGAQPHRRWWSGALDDALYVTACRQLALRLDDPLLTAAHVAAVLGCSRAHLYRLFTARDETVAGRLHRLRMQRAAALLVRHPHSAVGMVALACGYTDLSAFGKAFRRAHGAAPGAWRDEHAHAPGRVQAGRRTLWPAAN